MSNVQIGCGQITWRGQDDEAILADIAQAGYAGAPAGPNKDKSTAEVLALWRSYGLEPAPAYLGADFWDKEHEAQILARAKAHADFAREAGVTELYVAPGGFMNYTNAQGLTRMQIAGNVTPEDAMTDDEFEQFAKVLNHVGEITLAQGVKSCFHNHVGSVIETLDEINRLFSMVNSELVFMGPDTGHLLWGGVDVMAFCQMYAERIKTIHIKDVNKAVLEAGVVGRWDYQTFSKNGIWTELGQGCLDFPALFDLLNSAGFDGWIIVETDVTQLSSPLESAMVSREYLKTLGY